MLMRFNAYFFCLVVATVDSIVSEKIDKVRASILAEVVRRNYLEELIEKAKSLESRYGSDYPSEISKALQDIVTKETRP